MSYIPHTPCSKEKLKSLKEDPSQEPATVSEHLKYMKVDRSIQYIACVTRPDLAFAAHSLARHMSASSKQHWLAAQHVMRYLQKTVNMGLQFINLTAWQLLLERHEPSTLQE